MRTINTLNPFPHGKILDQTKLKATADDKCNKNDKFCLWYSRKHSEEKEKLLVQAISPFPTMLSKGFFPGRVKRCHCVGTG